MGEWTNLKINTGVRYRVLTDPLGREFVQIQSLFGSFEQSVDQLRKKVQDPNVLVDVRKMFRAMLDYYEEYKHGVH